VLLVLLALPLLATLAYLGRTLAAVPSILQGRLLWRIKGAEVAWLAILVGLRRVVATVLDHALEARRVGRRHELEALGRRGSPGLGRGERLRPFAPRLCRLCCSLRCYNVPSVANGRLQSVASATALAAPTCRASRSTVEKVSR